MLKSITHPSLIHLKACEYQETRTLLVLTYCPGGDLFELASSKREILTPAMVQRMFDGYVLRDAGGPLPVYDPLPEPTP